MHFSVNLSNKWEQVTRRSLPQETKWMVMMMVSGRGSQEGQENGQHVMITQG